MFPRQRHLNPNLQKEALWTTGPQNQYNKKDVSRRDSLCPTFMTVSDKTVITLLRHLEVNVQTQCFTEEHH